MVAAAGRTPTLETVSAFCDGRLAAYKTPRDVVTIDSLPRNAAGKILKTELRLL